MFWNIELKASSPGNRGLQPANLSPCLSLRRTTTPHHRPLEPHHPHLELRFLCGASSHAEAKPSLDAAAHRLQLQGLQFPSLRVIYCLLAVWRGFVSEGLGFSVED